MWCDGAGDDAELMPGLKLKMFYTQQAILTLLYELYH